jgi:hypothetical protein
MNYGTRLHRGPSRKSSAALKSVRFVSDAVCRKGGLEVWPLRFVDAVAWVHSVFDYCWALDRV